MSQRQRSVLVLERTFAFALGEQTPEQRGTRLFAVNAIRERRLWIIFFALNICTKISQTGNI